MPKHPPEVLAQIARLYYVDNLSEKEIINSYGANLGVPNQAAVSRALQEARSLRVVSFAVDKDAALRGEPNTALGTDLKKFGIQRARVYGLPKMGGNSLHIALANHAADDPNARISISDNSHVAVAGGRAVCSFAHALARTGLNPVRNVTVSPLGGRLWLGRIWMLGEGRELERPLNPDYSALVTAMALNSAGSQGVRFSQISHGLHCRSKSEATEVMKTQCPFLSNGKWNWDLTTPDQAVCGVGVFDPDSGHRLVEFLSKAEGRERGPLFNRLHSALEMCDGKSVPYFGDVGNRIFAALPLPGASIDTKNLDRVYNRLLPLLRGVNDQSVVMKWEHLRAIAAPTNGDVHLIAGGRTKLEVLWTVLLAGYFNEKKRLISSVYTDSESALALLAALGTLQKASPEILGWYRLMTSKIFAP